VAAAICKSIFDQGRGVMWIGQGDIIRLAGSDPLRNNWVKLNLLYELHACLGFHARREAVHDSPDRRRNEHAQCSRHTEAFLKTRLRCGTTIKRNRLVSGKPVRYGVKMGSLPSFATHCTNGRNAEIQPFAAHVSDVSVADKVAGQWHYVQLS
jgi:hypothetical protein